jgi:hypothetical protein
MHQVKRHDDHLGNQEFLGQDDKPEGKEEQPLRPSFFYNGNLQPPEVGSDNEIEAEITTPVKRVTRSKSRMAAYAFPEAVEPPSADDSGPKGSLTRTDAEEAPAVHAKKADSKGFSATADQSRG